MVQIITQQSQKTRVTRRPNFPFAGIMRPYGLYPIWAHPVLPGETIQSISQKSRVIGMPVLHPLAGAWLESWLVYVKFTDIDPDLGQSFISDTYPTTGWTAAAHSERFFVRAGQVDWIRRATEAVHRAYFIHDNETPRTIDGVPMVKLNNVSWYQNMIFEPADQAVPTSDASTLHEHLQGWMMLQQMQMTELTYEKYLETYGVRPASPRRGDPEILAFQRSWTQPTNVINPTNGTPASAWTWVGDFTLEKPKLMTEPGFVLCLSAVRPKLFQAHIQASLIGNLWGFSDWFPSYTLQDPTAGVRELEKNDPVFASGATDAGTEKLLYDHRDLLNHGEQFVNTSTHPYRLPVSTGLSVRTGKEPEDLRGEYPTVADIDALFTGSTPATRLCYYEGIAHAVVSGHVTDTTR